MGIEFYTFDSELWFRKDDGTAKALTESDTEIIQPLLSIIRERYPSAYKALEHEYSKSALNVMYYQFLIVRRFCKCNFGNVDTTRIDIDGTSQFHFEKVDCPLRGECKFDGVICCPTLNTKISEAEMRVMKLVYKGMTKEEIAEMLYLSPNTIKNHIKSVYCKLGIHQKSEFVKYAQINNIFNN